MNRVPQFAYLRMSEFNGPKIPDVPKPEWQDANSMSERPFLAVNTGTPSLHPFAHIAASYEGDSWDELLETIKKNRLQDGEDTTVE